MKNGELKIEKGVPVPAPSHNSKGKGRMQTVMLSLKKGESFVVPSKHASNVYSAAKLYMPKNSYTIRAVDGGFRVWRIK